MPGGDAVSVAEAVAFWILGPIALAGALGMVFARNAVHSAMWLVLTMLSLGALYMAQGAPFLGFVQIIVYTGAVMMLFLFVLMLAGRDSSDSVVEVLRGQRVAALLFGVGLAVLLVATVGRAFADVTPAGLAAGGANWNGNVPGIGQLLFTRYLLAFELTSALLITAALGAMVLAYAQTRAHADVAGSARWSRPACAATPPGSRPCPGRASSPRRTRWRCPRSCPTAPSLRTRSPRSSTGPRSGPHLSPRRTTRTPSGRPLAERGGRGLRRGQVHRRLGQRRVDDGHGGAPVTPTTYLLLSALLFAIGAVGVLVRRNAIVVFMCIELMLNAVNLSLVTFARINGTLDGQVMAFFVMVVAAAEVVVGLAIIMSIFRTRRTASVDDANLLKY